MASVRKARVSDVPRILEIVNGFATEQVMLPRSPLAIYENLRDFVVASEGPLILGCGALHVVWEDLAEVRSIAVDPRAQGKGLGTEIAERLLADAEDCGVPKVFAFTYVPDFFAKLGFVEVTHAELPHKVFMDCMNCPKFNCCDETAMLKVLTGVPDSPPPTGPTSLAQAEIFKGPFPKRAEPDA